jgi:lysophospholipid acyltransferase (LPLAT)-like uncharacterized protein
MIHNKRANLLRIILVDYLALVSLGLIIVFGGFHAYMVLIEGRTITQEFSILLAVMTPAFGALLVWRIFYITSLFRDGKESTGIVNSVDFHRDRGSVIYIHNYMGKKYICRDLIMKTKATKKLTAGDKVVILFDTNKPKKAVIPDLYV